ncbi:MAG: RNA pyrophosphohydrolase [Proteobacteria bacterium]|nr:RNA pyrophosphohydrolase [Desulfobulbaceae bacterium]MBU4152580.1 RNA pyrophosphohydrolase [Pseudomonadota bacterium]
MSQFFRAGVGAVIVNTKGMALALERSDTVGAWQFPQGGIDDQEEPITSVYREIQEETGITPDLLHLIRPYPHLLSYELPTQWRSLKIGRGQTQQWYLFRFLPVHDAITLPSPGEFINWRWTTFPELLPVVAEFRKHIYHCLASEFTEIRELPKGHNP